MSEEKKTWSAPWDLTDEQADAALSATSSFLDIKGSQLTVNREKMKRRWARLRDTVVASEGGGKASPGCRTPHAPIAPSSTGPATSDPSPPISDWELPPEEGDETFDILWAANLVYNTFKEDERQGYKTKDKTFVIDILGKALGK